MFPQTLPGLRCFPKLRGLLVLLGACAPELQVGADREVKQKFASLGPSVRKVLDFSPSFQDNVMQNRHRERHLATVTRRLSTETCPCIPTSPPGAPAPQGGDTAASQMSHVFGAAALPPSRKLLRATLILPCLRGRAKQMPLCLLHPPPGSDTFSKCSPQIPPGQVVAESRPKTPHQQGN